MKEKAKKFITELIEILEQDLKDLQIDVLVNLIESDGPDARDQKKCIQKLTEIKTQIRLGQKREALPVLSKIPPEYLTKLQKDVREKVLKGENIANLSSFDAAVAELESASSDEAIMTATEKANWAVSDIINNEAKYGPLQSKVTDLFREFKDSVQVKVKKKAFKHPTVLKKVVEFTENSADRLRRMNTETNLKEINKEFSQNINNLLNIPEEKKEAVTKSNEYKYFMKLCFALRDRVKYDDAKKQAETLFSDEAKQNRKEVYDNRMQDHQNDIKDFQEKIQKIEEDLQKQYNLISGNKNDKLTIAFVEAKIEFNEEQKKSWQRYIEMEQLHIKITELDFKKQESTIDSLKTTHEFHKFFNEIWKALLELLDKFGLLPETTQVRNLKDSGKDWQKSVAERGSEVVKKHRLIPLNL